MSPYRDLDIEQLHKERDALVELQKRASQGRARRRRLSLKRFFPRFPSKGRRPLRRRRLSAGSRSARERRLRSTPRLLRSTGRTSKPWTRMASWMNGNCQRSSIKSGVSISLAPLKATFGLSLEICRARPEISCGTDTVGNSPFLPGLRVSFRMAPKYHLDWRLQVGTAKRLGPLVSKSELPTRLRGHRSHWGASLKVRSIRPRVQAFEEVTDTVKGGFLPLPLRSF
jgi:hypothetical protein